MDKAEENKQKTQQIEKTQIFPSHLHHLFRAANSAASEHH